MLTHDTAHLGETKEAFMDFILYIFHACIFQFVCLCGLSCLVCFYFLVFTPLSRSSKFRGANILKLQYLNLGVIFLVNQCFCVLKGKAPQ